MQGLHKLEKLEPRIGRLENQAKSDLLAVTTKMSDILKVTKTNMTKEQGVKLCYKMGLDIAEALMDTKKHRSGKEATWKNPRRDPEV